MNNDTKKKWKKKSKSILLCDMEKKINGKRIPLVHWLTFGLLQSLKCMLLMPLCFMMFVQRIKLSLCLYIDKVLSNAHKKPSGSLLLFHYTNG